MIHKRFGAARTVVRHLFIKLATIAAILFFFGAGTFAIWAATIKIPDFSSFNERRVSQSTKIYDKTGTVILYDIHENIKRQIVPYEDISTYIKNATVAIEDAEFYQHSGIKPISIIRAFLVNLQSGSLKQGGSTITQQVIKNSILTTDKQISRKIKEVVLALKLEKNMTKDEILSIYLNESPYGGAIYGVEEASQKFFGKPAKDVTLAQAAYLAAIPNAPTFYSPYGNNKDKLVERKNLVLSKMVDLKYITEKESEAAKKEKVVFQTMSDGGIRAPHFVDMVKQYLEEKYGNDALTSRGFKVITTLDWNLQQKAEVIVTKYGNENEEKYKTGNAGLVAIDPKTGQVLSMVGSRDYYNTANDGNFNVTLAHRQPGSSFKPFVYATAFNKGYLPETVLFDLQTQFQSTCDENGKPLFSYVKETDCYMPQNYDEKFRGPITLREALAQSINIPAIKLLYLVGISDSITTARNMGVRGLDDPMRYGLTLVLGGGEVSLIDMTSAYGVFANDGVRNPYKFILKVEDNSGTVLEEFTPEPNRVIPENTARQISSILSDQKAREPIFGTNPLMVVPGRDIAIKTGTTNDYKDVWAVGYAPNIVVGAWAGNNDNTSMEHKIAGLVITPLWNAFITEALASLPVERFVKPAKENTVGLPPAIKGVWSGGNEYVIDKISKKLATEYTPIELRETKTIKSVHSILYWIDKSNPKFLRTDSPENDPQFRLWEIPVRKWVADQKIVEEDSNVIPKEFDDVHKPEYSPLAQITEPSADIMYNQNQKINITISTTERKFPVSRADYFFNDIFIGSSVERPFSFSFTPSDTGEITNINNVMKVIIYDSVLNKTEVVSNLKISI